MESRKKNEDAAMVADSRRFSDRLDGYGEERPFKFLSASNTANIDYTDKGIWVRFAKFTSIRRTFEDDEFVQMSQTFAIAQKEVCCNFSLFWGVLRIFCIYSFS